MRHIAFLNDDAAALHHLASHFKALSEAVLSDWAFCDISSLGGCCASAFVSVQLGSQHVMISHASHKQTRLLSITGSRDSKGTRE